MNKFEKHWFYEGYKKGLSVAVMGVAMEHAPDPLSGEWAGESIPEIFGSWEKAAPTLMDAYEEGYWTAFAHHGMTGA